MRAAPIPSSSPFTFFLSPHFPGGFSLPLQPQEPGTVEAAQ